MKFLLVILTFITGAVLSSTFGMSPVLGGSVLTGISLFIPVSKAGVLNMAVGFDLTEINAQVGAYSRKFAKSIWTQIYASLTLEKHMKKIPNQMGEYVSISSKVGEVLQSFQCAWTPKGTVSFDAYINKVRHIKLDFELECIDALYSSYLSFMTDETKLRKDWPFVKYIVQEHLIPKVVEDLQNATYNGVYLAPTDGTAGAAINIVDGIGTIVTNEIAAGNITPIAVGPLTPANMEDKIRLFIDSLPIQYRKKGGEILLSETNLELYADDYADNHGAQSDFKSGDAVKVWNRPKFKLVGDCSMEGSNRFLYTTKGNMVAMYNKIYVPGKFHMEMQKRQVCIMADFHRGYGFETLEEVFASDNP